MVYLLGGSVKWKWRICKRPGLIMHTKTEQNEMSILRGLGQFRDYTKAESCGADSVDGSGPSRNNRMDIPIKFLEIISKRTDEVILMIEYQTYHPRKRSPNIPPLKATILKHTLTNKYTIEFPKIRQ